MTKQSNDKPVQYTQGFVEFYKLKFKVDERVLIPRPETELLVDEVITFILRAQREVTDKTIIVSKVGSRPASRDSNNNNNFTILDIGTGSGNIAISLAKNLPKAKIFATDISEDALDLARENAKLNKVTKRILFLQSDLLNVIASEVKQSSSMKKIATGRTKWYIPRNDGGVDILVTNLPYIPTQRIPYLDPSVKDFEPRIALDGGEDGFELYRKLFQQIVDKFLNPVILSEAKNIYPSATPQDDNKLKLIVCEIDYTQGELAVQEAQRYFPKASVEVKTDLAKKQRILLIRYHVGNSIVFSSSDIIGLLSSCSTIFHPTHWAALPKWL